MEVQWWKNGWTSFPSRSQGPFHYQTHFRMFFGFFFSKIFFELGWNSKKKILVRELNEPLKCQICSGYLINPTVVNECQHTFCKTVSKEECRSICHIAEKYIFLFQCILTHYEDELDCPVCGIVSHPTTPEKFITKDEILQQVKCHKLWSIIDIT